MKELHEAAERLRRMDAGENPVDVYGTHNAPPMRRGTWGPYEAKEAAHANAADDCETLADAYLAEHDPTPLTEAWLRRVGFDDEFGDLRLSHTFGEHAMSQLKFHHRTGEWSFGSGTQGWQTMTPIHNLTKTRGDLIRLASALGISLKEST